ERCGRASLSPSRGRWRDHPRSKKQSRGNSGLVLLRSGTLDRAPWNLVSEDDADSRITNGKPAELGQAFDGARAIVAREGSRGDVLLEGPGEMARVADEKRRRIAVHQVGRVIGRVAWSGDGPKRS